MSEAVTKHSILEHDKMLLRKNFWSFLGGKFRIFDMNDSIIATAKQKAFKLKEDIKVFSDEAMTNQILQISARSIMDFSAAYDITDVTTDEKVGAMRRKGWKSILKDEWQILNLEDEVIGTVKEDSAGMAILRRFLTNLIPQKFFITLLDQPMGMIKQHFNPFIFKATMDLTQDADRVMDRRLAVGCAILLMAIEGRQQ